MKGRRKRLGAFGEGLAQDYLKSQGYKIIDKNFRCCFGEVDIVAEDNNSIVFIEVKTRSSLAFGTPKDAISMKKKTSLTKVASAYLKKSELTHRSARFDVVSILITDKEGAKIELIKNAFDLTSS